MDGRSEGSSRDSALDLDRASERIAVVVDQLLEAHPSIPGMAVALRGPDATTVAVVRGVADPASGAPLTIDHAYRIASCTKSFVAATVVSLAGDGLLDLDGPVFDLVPSDVAALFTGDERCRDITVRQVLQHRSGLVDHTYFPEFMEAMDSTWTAIRQLTIAAARPLLFAPGSAFSYSDSGYVILGQLVEHLTGEPLATAVRRRAGLDAGAMPSLHWELVEPSPPNLVRAHQLLEGHDTLHWSATLDLFGGGGLVSALPDLCTWWSTWFGHLHGMIDVHIAAPAPTDGPDGTRFVGGDRAGLGLFGREVDGYTVWAHGGFWGLETGHVPELGLSYGLSMTHRAAGIPAATTVATSLLQAFTTG